MPDITSIITSVATGVFKSRVVDRWIDDLIESKELDKAINVAVEHTSKDFPQLFIWKQGTLENFWKGKKVINELWELLVDRSNLERTPDFTPLWDAYRTTWTDEKTRIPRPKFDQAMETFWYRFLEEAENKPLLGSYYDKKIKHLKDDTVYPHQGREMIAEYCTQKLTLLEHDLSTKFIPDEFESDENLKKEFLTYHRAGLTYVPTEHHQVSSDEKPVKTFLEHNRAIFIGDGGVGKTRFFKELEKYLLNNTCNQTTPDNLLLPIYFEANDFKDKTPQYLKELIELPIIEAFDRSSKYKDKNNKIKGFINYVIKDKRIFFLIDAFDQVKAEREENIFTILAKPTLFGGAKCYINTRPYYLTRLSYGIKGNYGDSFKTMRLHPFTEEELKQFFKVCYSEAEPIIEKLKHSAKDQINVLRIPLLATIVKTMIMDKDYKKSEKISDGINRTNLLENFVDFVVKRQIRRDGNKPGMKQRYTKMLLKLKDLSLRTLEDNDIYRFPQETANDIFGNEYFEDYERALMVPFIRPFVDYESMESFNNEDEHRYQHQIFQEFFAAQKLYQLYKAKKYSEMLESLEKLTLKDEESKNITSYMPEVGSFLAEMVEQNCKDPQTDFDYWQGVLMSPDTKDWARTYALQVRDKLGEGKAKHCLERLFAEENEKLNTADPEAEFITIPADAFICGSYEYNDEQSVRLVVDLPEFEIARYPVTNKEYKKFVDDGGYTKKEYLEKDWTENGRQWREEENVTQPEYWDDKKYNQPDCPVVGVSWYEAAAYCKWLSRKTGHNYCLPTEEQWEKAARALKGRRYPWANEFDKGKCNIDESGIGKTTPVSQYPQGISPYGCFDMAGNVWGWTKTKYDTKETRDDFKVEETWQEGPVLRGGSWDYSQNGARCSARGYYSPNYRNYNLGFRLSRTSS